MLLRRRNQSIWLQLSFYFKKSKPHQADTHIIFHLKVKANYLNMQLLVLFLAFVHCISIDCTYFMRNK